MRLAGAHTRRGKARGAHLGSIEPWFGRNLGDIASLLLSRVCLILLQKPSPWRLTSFHVVRIHLLHFTSLNPAHPWLAMVSLGSVGQLRPSLQGGAPLISSTSVT
jgi:hypothetical protein